MANFKLHPSVCVSLSSISMFSCVYIFFQILENSEEDSYLSQILQNFQLGERTHEYIHGVDPSASFPIIRENKSWTVLIDAWNKARETFRAFK